MEFADLREKVREPFIGFQFGDYHTSQFGLKRVSSSNRFEQKLGPNFKDTTTQPGNGDGVFYWNTQNTQREWNISLAFDDLTELELRQLSQWLNSKDLGVLIFDETPYKAYKVKLKSPAQLKYLCFDQLQSESNEAYLPHIQDLGTVLPMTTLINNQRVYKGECTVSFVAYEPYAEVQSKYLVDYTSQDYYLSEWRESSGLLETEPIFRDYKLLINTYDFNLPNYILMQYCSQDPALKLKSTIREVPGGLSPGQWDAIKSRLDTTLFNDSFSDFIQGHINFSSFYRQAHFSSGISIREFVGYMITVLMQAFFTSDALEAWESRIEDAFPFVSVMVKKQNLSSYQQQLWGRFEDNLKFGYTTQLPDLQLIIYTQEKNVYLTAIQYLNISIDIGRSASLSTNKKTTDSYYYTTTGDKIFFDTDGLYTDVSYLTPSGVYVQASWSAYTAQLVASLISQIEQGMIPIYNPGDIQSDWTCTIKCPEAFQNQFYDFQITLIQKENEQPIATMKLEQIDFNLINGQDIKLDSKTHLIYAYDSTTHSATKLLNRFLLPNFDTWFQIPTNTTFDYYIKIDTNPSLDYNFDYTYYYY